MTFQNMTFFWLLHHLLKRVDFVGAIDYWSYGIEVLPTNRLLAYMKNIDSHKVVYRILKPSTSYQKSPVNRSKFAWEHFLDPWGMLIEQFILI